MLIKLETIQFLCREYDIRPNRRAGQNFLINQSVVDKMIEAADLKKTDIVLEIGPGFGVLTKELAPRVKKVIAVELDRRIARALEEILGDYKNIEIINTDILRIGCFSVIRGNDKERIFRNLRSYKIVASLPYNITSAVLRKFLPRTFYEKKVRGLSEEPKPSEMVLLVQKEVAERIAAKPRSASSGQAGQMSLLAVSVQFYAQPEIVAIVSKNNFWPEPKVDSAIIKLRARDSSPLTGLGMTKGEKGLGMTEGERGLGMTTEKEFFRIVRIGFSARRKQLQNNLSAGLKIPKEEAKKILEKAGFDPKVRAQDLSVDEWVRLVSKISKIPL